MNSQLLSEANVEDKIRNRKIQMNIYREKNILCPHRLYKLHKLKKERRKNHAEQRKVHRSDKSDEGIGPKCREGR